MEKDQRTSEDQRDESEAERDDRNLVELLQEARVVQTGVQSAATRRLAAV